MKTFNRVKVGEVFGRLTAKERLTEKDKFNRTIYLCDCSCGNKNIRVAGPILRNGDKKSCGCLANSTQFKQKNEKDATYNFLECSYKLAAKKRNLNFSLTRDIFRKLITSSCFYCGNLGEIVNRYRNKSGKIIAKYSEDWINKQDICVIGIDHKDNSKGYTLENCVPCCKMCNYIKRNYSEQQLFNHLEKMIQMYKKRTSA